MPSDEMPVSLASGRYIEGGRQNAKHFLKMPSDEMPGSLASGHHIEKKGSNRCYQKILQTR